ncbi:MAG: hypothetical protein NVV72_08320 [Asticcacaulis sp.]|nr:hypothetical protein [Asticcacaulis sp.]
MAKKEPPVNQPEALSFQRFRDTSPMRLRIGKGKARRRLCGES